MKRALRPAALLLAGSAAPTAFAQAAGTAGVDPVVMAEQQPGAW